MNLEEVSFLFTLVYIYTHYTKKQIKVNSIIIERLYFCKYIRINTCLTKKKIKILIAKKNVKTC